MPLCWSTANISCLIFSLPMMSFRRHEVSKESSSTSFPGWGRLGWGESITLGTSAQMPFHNDTAKFLLITPPMPSPSREGAVNCSLAEQRWTLSVKAEGAAEESGRILIFKKINHPSPANVRHYRANIGHPVLTSSHETALRVLRLTPPLAGWASPSSLCSEVALPCRGEEKENRRCA